MDLGSCVIESQEFPGASDSNGGSQVFRAILSIKTSLSQTDQPRVTFLHHCSTFIPLLQLPQLSLHTPLTIRSHAALRYPDLRDLGRSCDVHRRRTRGSGHGLHPRSLLVWPTGKERNNLYVQRAQEHYSRRELRP